jgi:hypothetical protein
MVQQDAAKPVKHSNASVDEALAGVGVCGQVHLPTGRTCVRPGRHRGGCDFVGREDVPDRLEDGPARHDTS